MLIKVKNYAHYNRALGKYISSKAQYQKEMAKAGCVSFAEGERIAKRARERNHKDYSLSKKARDIIQTVNSKDRKHFKADDRLIDAMKDVGVSFDMQHCPKHYQPKGGFDASN